MTTTPTLDLTRLDGVHLVSGHHSIPDNHTGCAMDAIAWAATGEVTDMPACVHMLLARKVHRINDARHTTEDDRWLIVREGGPLLVGSDAWGVNRVLHVLARCGETAAGFVAALGMDPGTNLSGTNLSGTNLSGTNLSGTDLSGTNLSGTDLSGTNLSGTNLSDANLSGTDLSRADLSRADLSRADLSGTDLSRADLSGTDLSGANLFGANLSGTHLFGAYLSGANLSGANLSGAYLSGAHLSGAHLSGANLSRANLSRVNLSRALADKWTTWPAGFDAAAAGVVTS